MPDYNTQPLSPEDEALIGEMFDFVDSYPEDAFIKVYPRRLRDFCRQVIAAARLRERKSGIKMTRARVGAIVLLGLRTDQEGYCYPGAYTSAAQIGMRSASGSRYIHRVLETIGAVESDFTADRRSRRFKLPTGIFIFGRDSYHGKKFATPYDEKIATAYGQKFAANKSQDSVNQKPCDTNQTNHAQSAPLGGNNAKSETAITPLTQQQQDLFQEMIRLHLDRKEAAIIAYQYHPKTIISALQDARRLYAAGKIANLGAWLRRTIEKRANQPLLYNHAGISAVQALLHGSAPDSPTAESAATQWAPVPPKNIPPTQTPSNTPSAPNTTTTGAQQRDLGLTLVRLGVRPLEAALIASQFAEALIREAIEQMERQRSPIANRGAWLRAYVEKRAKRRIAYAEMSSPVQHLFQEVQQAAEINPYLIDPYEDVDTSQQRKAERAALEAQSGAWDTR